ncbi:MAG: membrane protein insertion efficiency factor YidD [Nitrospiria bacterium]
MVYLLTTMVRIYQSYLSPLFPPVCRFYPTCSSFAIQALRRHGFFLGILMVFKRLAKCHPLCPGGYDPVK